MLGRLPADHSDELYFDATSRFREKLDGPLVASTLTARRVEQTLASSSVHSIIQGDLHWTDLNGLVLFETTNIFGVDRHTRANLPGYGDVVRTGQYFFPPHTGRQTTTYWDPQFIGSRVATFQRVERRDGVDLLVFRFTAAGLDETAGYSQLPEVPERYQVLTDAWGTLWVEPVSGTVVDYFEKGTSFFAEPASGKHLTELYIWEAKYTAASRASKLAQAKQLALRAGLFSTWIPLALAGAGAALLLAGFLARRRARGHATPRLGSTP